MNLYPDIVKSVCERGHEIASHTYQHAQLTKLDATALDEEIKKITKKHVLKPVEQNQH